MIVDSAHEIHITLPESLRRPVIDPIHRLSLNVLFAHGLNTYGISEGWRAAIEVQIRTCARCGVQAHEWTFEVKGCDQHRWIVSFETVFERFGDTAQEAIDNLGEEVSRRWDDLGNVKYALPVSRKSGIEEQRRWYYILESWYQALEDEMRALVSR